ncbi:MAG: YjbH domain-containing protein, partial [Gammaproteobacteria bacterium]
DSFTFNSYNNHGVVGLINMPTARFYDEMAHGVTIYDGTPDQKITLTSNPYNWLEASFFYTNIQGKPYCQVSYDPICQQDYKDKGFNFKLRLKEEDSLPAIAIGINDIAGTGFYSSEYIVGSYGINKFDFHFGIGWGRLNGSSKKFNNPLGYLDEQFKIRPSSRGDRGGQFDTSRYFSGLTTSPFYGISYAYNKKLVFKFEHDTTQTPGKVGYDRASSEFSFGLDYSINDNFNVGVAFERNNNVSIKFIYKNNPSVSYKKYKYEKAESEVEDNKYTKLVNNLEKNGIGVNKIIESSRSIGLELTQFTHPNIDLIEEIIRSASIDAGIKKPIKKDIKIANLKAVSEIDQNEELNNQNDLVYLREAKSSINTKTGLKFRPFIASREEFFKGALMLENDTEIILLDNLFFNLNLKYSISNNFDDLKYPPVDTFPAQVRSDVKQYLKKMNDSILLGRAQFDYHITPMKNHHIMMSAGVLEDMFSGYGVEYLYFKQDTNYAYGFEIFEVQKRDYNWRLGLLDYKNTTGAFNFYYRNYGLLPFDAKISLGEYLAGDVGATIEFSRTYRNGMKFGVFASNTNVSAAEFGEGSFDKGITFNIPIYGNLINYTWRPLTKDPGSKLIRRNSLYDLLVRFKPLD